MSCGTLRPLQNTIGAIAGAQAITFGMMGVGVTPDGAITIDPHPPRFAPDLSLTGLRLRGRCLDIVVAGRQFTVTEDGSTITSSLGEPVVLTPPAGQG